MAQTLFKATGITADNKEAIKDSALTILSNVKWININDDSVVVTHGDDFDADAFSSALQNAHSGISLTKS